MLRTTLDGLWTQNCKVGGLCGRGNRGGNEAIRCDTRAKHKNWDDYCGQCLYGWRRPDIFNDWCCTWTDFINNRDCKCQAEYAPECQRISSITQSGVGRERSIIRSTRREGSWRENCNPGGLCGRGTRGGNTTATCDTRNSKKNDPDYCGQCRYGFRHPWMNWNDWCCTWDDFRNNRDCLCQEEYAPNCPAALSTSGEKSNFYSITSYVNPHPYKFLKIHQQPRERIKMDCPLDQRSRRWTQLKM